MDTITASIIQDWRLPMPAAARGGIVARCRLDTARWRRYVEAYTWPVGETWHPTVMVGANITEPTYPGEPTIVEVPSGRVTLEISGLWSEVVMAALTTEQIYANALEITAQAGRVEIVNIDHPGEARHYRIESDVFSPAWWDARRLRWNRFVLPLRC